jgi:predicted transposase/invertase (TIGR01784 family)
MADYALRLQRRYSDPAIEIRQIVVYLKQTGSRLAQQTRYQRGSLVHEFEVIRLWEQDPKQLEGLTGLLPFRVLMDPQQGEERLRQVAGQIERIPDEGVRADIAAATAVLAGLALDKELVKRILGEMTMRESAIYQEWREEALREGELRGIQLGEQRGKLASVPILAQLGLSAEEIAQRLDLPPELVAQALDP